MDVAIIDIVFMVIIAVFVIRCALRGFVSELMSMAALIFGLLAAIFFFRVGAIVVRSYFLPGMSMLPEIIAFVLLFLLVFIAIKIVEALLKRIIDGIQLGGVDRFLGILFGFAQGIIVVCLLLFLINIQPFFNPGDILRGSFFADMLMEFIVGNRPGTLEEGMRGITDV